MSVVSIALSGALMGCAGLGPFADQVPIDSLTDDGDTPLTTTPITGWDREEVTTFGSMVSPAVAAMCPPPWDMVSGQEIVELLNQPEEMEFHICVFTRTPDSLDPNVVDEIAYRVDSGGAELAMAYAQYPFGAEQALCVDEMVALLSQPVITIVIENVTYGIQPGPGWCPSTQPENQALLNALQLTMVVRDTVGPNG
ncbi:MAG: hypothetical protein RLZZ608_81 [Actinomycetota bacterium]|jgi:hypothetical protein